MYVNNLNLDFTNDIRRSVPDAITQFYQAQGSSSPIKVGLDEHNLRSRDKEPISVWPTGQVGIGLELSSCLL